MGSTEQEFDAPTAGAARTAPTSSRKRATLATGAVALLAAATLAACGSDDSSSETSASTGTVATQAATTAEENGVADLSGDEVLAAARDAALGATAVHVSGRGDGVALDLNLVRGEGASGTIAPDGNELEMVAVGGNAYLKGSDEFWRQVVGDAAVDLLGGKWLRVDSEDEDFASFTDFTDLETLMGQLLTPEGRTVTKGEVETRDGQDVIPLTGETGRGTLYVAATGEPFPVAVVPSEAGGGEVTFDGWNEPVELTAPADAVDVAALEGLARG